MPTDNTTVFNRVVIGCNCDSLDIHAAWPMLGPATIPDGVEFIHVDSTVSSDRDQLEIMRDAVRNGHGPARTTELAANIDADDTEISVNDAALFSVNDVIKISEEEMKITAISDDDLTVERGYNGTAGDSHTSGSYIFFRVDLYYRDRDFIPYDELPLKHWLIHTLHDIHPDEKWKSLQTMMLASDVHEDADTEKPTVTVGIDIASRNRIPAGDDYNAHLYDWRVLPVDDDSFQLQLDVDPLLEWTQADVTSDNNLTQDLPGMRAMKAFLLDLQVAPSIPEHAAFGLTFSVSFLNKNYDWEQESNSTVRFQIAGSLGIMSAGYNSEGFLTTITFECDTNASYDDYNEDLMQHYLDTQTIETPVDGDCSRAYQHRLRRELPAR